MSNRMVRCSGCHQYFLRESCLRIGLSNFHSKECFFSKKPKPHFKRASVTWDLKQEVHAADGDRCRVCGTLLDLHAHHVRYRDDPGSTDERNNLISLCGGLRGNNCHDLMHNDKKRFQPLLLGLIYLREVMGDECTTVYELERHLQELGLVE